MSFTRRIGTLLLVAGCSAPALEEDSSEQWAGLVTDDTPAVLENASSADDHAPASLAVDDSDDPAEVDEDPDDDDTQGIAAKASYVNAVLGSCADPGVIKLGTGFEVACTGGGYPSFTSPDLVHWKKNGTLFSAATRPKWASDNFWAPEIHHIGSDLVVYFAALSPARKKMCIGAARQVNGVYQDIGKPLVCDSGVSLIDPHVYSEGNKHWLYYKTDSNALRPQKPTVIYGHQLGADGVSFVGKRHALIQNTLKWEGDVVEAPWVTHHGSYYYMFYSGFRYCNPTYGVGVARSKSPLGPFTKKGAPILHSNGQWSGPGHNSVVSTGGKDWIVYHAYKGAHQCGDDGPRQLLIDPIGYKGGWPVIGNASPSSGNRTAPALP